MTHRTCIECGSDLPPTKRPDAKYCSSTCSASSEKRRYRERHGQTVNRRGPYAVERKDYPHKLEATRLRANTRYQIAVYGSPTPDPMMMTKDRYARARAMGYRSGLEVKVAKSLEDRGCPFEYEAYTLPYQVPARTARSTPDYVLGNGIVVETKGLWDSDDRKKVALIRAQYPDLDFRMVFNNPNAKITKGSKTSYADICIKLGIPFATKDIPTAWLNEPPNEKSLAILESMKK